MRTGWRIAISGLVVAAAAVGSFGMAWVVDTVEADHAFVIDSFDQRVVIEPDGDTRVTESIDVTFTEPRRGIFRDFDESTDFPSSGGYGDIEVDRGEDADRWNFAVEDGPTGPRVRIGDADVTLDPGSYHYRLSYDAPTWYVVPDESPGFIEVRIDTPGFDWPTTIGPSSLAVELPGEVRNAVCVEGRRGSTRPCRVDPVVDGTVARFETGPFDAQESATVSVLVDRGAISGEVPRYDATPLGDGSGPEPWTIGAGVSALLLFVALALPLLVWELVSARRLYRDRVTDPALHDRLHPTATPVPPHGFRPPEVAGLLARRDSDDLFLATLVDLDQRRAIMTSALSRPGSPREPDTEVLTLGPPPPGAPLTDQDAAFVAAVVPVGTTTFDGTYDASVANRVAAATALLDARATDVFVDHCFAHDDAGLFGRTGFRASMALGFLAFAAVCVWFVTRVTPIHLVTAAIVVLFVVLGWALARAPWRHHRLPLNSEGRDAVGRARSFREFLATVESEQLDWAAGQPGIDHHHPAVSLLPYAIALGLADSWYERFGAMMREVAVAGTGAAATAGATWWASQSSFAQVRASQAETTTSPASSTSGGGGGGSGGGGGGGGSW